MAIELSKADIISSDRIVATNRYQKEQIDQEPVEQFVLSFLISETDDPFKPSAYAIMKDLDTLIKQKSYTPISLYNSTYTLDSDYGFKATSKLNCYLRTFFL